MWPPLGEVAAFLAVSTWLGLGVGLGRGRRLLGGEHLVGVRGRVRARSPPSWR